MFRFVNLWLVGVLLLLSGCEREDRVSVVDADNYDSFWLWAGVKPQAVLDKATTVYILEGEVRAADPSQMVKLRAATPHIAHADIWMVVRVETLDWSPAVYSAILARLEGWSAAENRVIGLQIDFDAETRQLDRYAAFLSDLRRRLPSQYQLGTTGLLDWSANGDPSELGALSEIIDETVFQVYQGRHTIPGYQQWLGRLDDLPMPFKIGLVQNGQWQEPQTLGKNANFRGYVVFLLNPKEDEIRVEPAG